MPINSAAHPLHASCVVDQKDLNEAIVTAIAAVAQRNTHHCAELFRIPLRLAERFQAMAHRAIESHGEVDHLLDLSTTPSALWRVVMSAEDVSQMQRREVPMLKPYLEPYRGIVARLNEQVILTLLRYTADSRAAALVSGFGDLAFQDAMSSASCSTLLQSAKNMGRPLVELTIHETYLDRVFLTPTGLPVDATTRALIARVLCRWDDCAKLMAAVEDEVVHAAPPEAPRIGRPTAVFLPPGEADMLQQLVRQGVPTKTILAFTGSEVNSAQLRRLRHAAGHGLGGPDEEIPQPAPADDSRRVGDSNASVWGSALRRLAVTSIFAHQRVLMELGLPAHTAFVEAHAHYLLHHSDPASALSLPRVISAVFMPMRAGLVHLGHCSECGTMHLTHDGHHNGIECPVCAMAKFNKIGRVSGSGQARAGGGEAPAASQPKGKKGGDPEAIGEDFADSRLPAFGFSMKPWETPWRSASVNRRNGLQVAHC